MRHRRFVVFLAAFLAATGAFSGELLGATAWGFFKRPILSRAKAERLADYDWSTVVQNDSRGSTYMIVEPVNALISRDVLALKADVLESKQGSEVIRTIRITCWQLTKPIISREKTAIAPPAETAKCTSCHPMGGGGGVRNPVPGGGGGGGGGDTGSGGGGGDSGTGSSGSGGGGDGTGSTGSTGATNGVSGGGFTSGVDPESGKPLALDTLIRRGFNPFRIYEVAELDLEKFEKEVHKEALNGSGGEKYLVGFVGDTPEPGYLYFSAVYSPSVTDTDGKVLMRETIYLSFDQRKGKKKK